MSMANPNPVSDGYFTPPPPSRTRVDRFRDVLRRLGRMRSMVSREPGFVAALRRTLKMKPVLYHFEVHLTDHCNLNCVGCSHFSNICPETFADLAEFESDMNRVASLLTVRQIHLLGGEPLLHPQVAEFIRAARAAFPRRTRIYLMTNGVLVTHMDMKFWDAMHDTRTTLLCTDFPISLPRSEIELIADAARVKVQWTAPQTEFHKVPIDPLGGHDAISSFHRCRAYNNRPILRDGKFYPCAYVAYSDVLVAERDVSGLNIYPTDWISIREESDAERIVGFLRNPVHWCTHCDMDNLTTFPWTRENSASRHRT